MRRYINKSSIYCKILKGIAENDKIHIHHSLTAENFSKSLRALRTVESWVITSVGIELENSTSFNSFFNFLSASVTVIFDLLSTMQSVTGLFPVIFILQNYPCSRAHSIFSCLDSNYMMCYMNIGDQNNNIQLLN